METSHHVYLRLVKVNEIKLCINVAFHFFVTICVVGGLIDTVHYLNIPANFYLLIMNLDGTFYDSLR